MKRFKSLFVIILVLIPGIFLFSYELNSSKTLHSEKPKISKTSDSIHIVGNQGWIDFRDDDNCTGQGTELDPYVIKNLVISGDGFDDGIFIYNSTVYFKIENCTVYDFEFSGIFLSKVDNGLLINNTCSNNNYGIYVSGLLTRQANKIKNINVTGNYLSNNWMCGIIMDKLTNYGCFFSNNTIINSRDGIVVSRSEDLVVKQNKILDCTEGISIDGVFGNNTFKFNSLINCGFSFSAGYSGEYPLKTVDNSNTVNGKPFYYYHSKSGLNSSDFVNGGQIVLINCSNSFISNLNLSKTTTGISLIYSNNTNISNNTLNYNKYSGIGLGNSHNNSIRGNFAEYNGYSGLSCGDSNNNIVENNTFRGNMRGFLLSNCNNSIISRNRANHNNFTEYQDMESSGCGFILWKSHNNILIENIANYNTYCGVYLGDNGITDEESNSNSLIGNNFSFNGLWGIYLKGDYNNITGNNRFYNNGGAIFLLSDSENNVIYNNSFIDNNAEDKGISNYWDNGVIGNYWDDYIFFDLNDDGIGDTPYRISGVAASKDYFPIWDDGEDIAPIVIINFPHNGSSFGYNPPNFNVEIIEENPDKIWYTINDGGIKYFCLNNGSINKEAWRDQPYGLISIKFYVNDTKGKINSSEVTTIKTTKKNPAPFILTTDAGVPENDGKFNITWEASIGADNYSIYKFNKYINEINQSLTLIAEGISLTEFPFVFLYNDAHYFVVVAYNESGLTMSNCLKIVTQLPVYYLGIEEGDEIIWEITEVDEQGLSYLTHIYIPEEARKVGAKMKMLINKIFEDPSNKGYWNITVSNWNCTENEFADEPDIVDLSYLVPMHAFGFNMISWICPIPVSEFLSNFEYPAYINRTGNSIIGILGTGNMVLEIIYSFNESTGVESLFQFRYGNGTIIYERILVSIKNIYETSKSSSSIPSGNIYLILLILSFITIIYIYKIKKLDKVLLI